MKICAVSYLNTKPFLYGLENLIPDAEIVLHIPSLCVEHFQNHLSDVALIPVGSLLDFQEVHVIDDFCIGADGKVDSVFLFAQKPIHQLNTIYLDAHSRTSNGLAKVLAKYHWNQNLHFLNTPLNRDSYQFINDTAGAIVIGDRSIQRKNDYLYVYDLAQEWKHWTGLPFVFAVWAFHYSEYIIEKIPDRKSTV
jgi:chorismate dehydratase